MNKLIELSQQLISIKSYSGKNDEVLQLIKSILEKASFSCDIIDFSGDNSYPVNNLHAIFNPKNSNKTLYFAGHTDVVSEGNNSLWKFDPFSGKIHDGKIFGRGAADMKCAIACFIIAVLEYLQENKNPDFGIGFLITNDEENDSINGTKKVLEWMSQKKFPISHCIVGEPTNPDKIGEMIKVGRRGSVGFKVRVTGKQGHVAYPENAINPITILINLLKILKDHKFDEGNKFFDPTNLEITSIVSENLGGNVIPNQAEANFNVRFNNHHSSNSIIEFVKYACEKTIGFGAKFTLEYKTSGESFLSKIGELEKNINLAIQKTCNRKPIISTSGGTSDARFIKDFAEVVEFGLINKTAHQIDEFSKIDEVEKLQKVYLEVLRNFNR